MEPYVRDPSKPATFIFDIDGTIALHGDERGHFEYEKVSGDTPNNEVIAVLKELLHSDYLIVFMSGREDRCRLDTAHWINRHVEPYAELWDGLFMRKTGDYRKDAVIKGELFDKYVRPYYDVVAVFEDRDQMVKMWREAGITCLQVADGSF